MHLEGARGLQRHRGFQPSPQLEYLTRPNEPGGAEHRFRFHVIGRAPLIAGTPSGRTALIVGGRMPRLRARVGDTGDEHDGEKEY
jgi:hypothetical protein